MIPYPRLRTVFKWWAGGIFSLVLAYLLLVYPRHGYNDRGGEAAYASGQKACDSVRNGMGLQEVLRAIHTRTEPFVEGFEGSKLVVDGCWMEFADAKMISAQFRQNAYGGDW